MPTVPDVIECGESGSGSLVINSDGTQSRATQLRWLVGGMSGYDAAEARGKRLAPDTLRGHRRIRLEPQVVGGGWYQITAEYANGSIVLPPTPGCLGTFGSWQFDFESKTEHITQAWTDSSNPNAYVKAAVVGFPSFGSLGTSAGATYVPAVPASPDYQPASPDYSPGPPVVGTAQIGTAPIPGHFEGGIFVPDFRGTIGVEVDQVRGADIPKASLSWAEVWHFPAWLLTEKRPPLKKLGNPDADGKREPYEIEQPPLLQTMEKLSNTTNLKPFRGFETGEVLLGTPRSSQISDGQSMATVTFPFSVSRTKTDFYVGDILVSRKEGWDILDILYETASEATMTIKKPRVVYTMKVIPPADFSPLGIGEALPKYWLDDSQLAHTFDDFVGRV